ncbi:5'-nucleotidase /3'-nucleotidase /exopolyphosphatase [Breoghania corrubedonensis]|uniref:5'-nucleotidase SurE n=1 Tax=Breoghania corrubedonensis TaxID=665038 RepID=A0A2T5V8G2_9HYPH|nr:5'/3'-nucleotidase SurE [Breoghania corrubedonensis]PTW60046.1 5'-nucleotidase /3'-nucleotidase /exopolyphosphatase [Breoghania corrubedonensis]
MRILVTNDDGIHAPGLKVAESIARTLTDEVWVVAPESDQSGVAHSLSLNDPLRLRSLGFNRYAVRGTPTDCVIMGVKHIMKEAPDLVISGVNRGQNLADDVTYSGTVAGAMEGTLLGIRSVALSQAYGIQNKDKPPFETAEHHAPELLRRLLERPQPVGKFYNINFPDCAPEAVVGIEVAVQGRRNAEQLYVDERADGRGNPYFWIGFRRMRSEPEPGTDLHAIYAGKISVTPLGLDLTDHASLSDLGDFLA